MRTYNERLDAMHRRAGEIRHEKQNRREKFIQYASFSASLLLVIAIAFLMPKTEGMPIPDGTGNMSASLFTNSSFLGYVVISIFSFLLGSAVTTFCFRIRKLKKADKPEDLIP